MKSAKQTEILWFRRRQWIWKSLIIIIIACLVVLLGLKLYMKLKNPYCGSNFNPNMRYCDPNNNKIVIGLIPSNECDPADSLQFNEYLNVFLRYIEKISIRDKKQLFRYFSEKSSLKVYQGLFYFAIPELLKILPTDFGQNHYTPYGILSFFNLYPSCISSLESLCNHIFHKKTPENKIGELLCIEYLRWMKKRAGVECPFSINENNNNIVIEDPDFFNEIGMLGSFSLDISQVIVLYVKFPVASLDLNYWSFNLYISDSMSPDAKCNPYRQTVVASVCPSFNLYTEASQSDEHKNPVLKENVHGFLIIGHDKELISKTKRMVSDAPFFDKYDFIQEMKIPSGKDSMVIDPSLPNPNSYTEKDSIFHPEYQRLTLFLRLSARPDASADAVIGLKNMIYFDSDTVEFETVLIDYPKPLTPSLYHSIDLPPMIDPPFNEIEMVKTEFTKIHRKIVAKLFYNLFWIHRLPCRNSITNLFAPLYQNLLRNPNLEYKGGFQAIQLAGNAQGDNYDAQYRSSSGVCIGPDDVLFSLAVNHSFFNNCVNNSVNIIDLNRAYGFASVQLDNRVSFPFYIILFGRNNELLNYTESILLNALDTDMKNRIKIYKTFIKTGSTLQGGFPACHQALMVERVYLNTNYLSKDGKTVFNLQKLFGKDLMSIHNDIHNEEWNSMSNLAAPKNNHLLKPFYLKTTYSEKNSQKLVLWFIYILIGVLFIILLIALIDIWNHWRKKKFKQKRAE